MTDNTAPVLCLASGSAQRKALLEQIGVNALVRPMDIDEQRLGNEAVEDYVSRLAVGKASAGFESVEGALPTLGADTVISLDSDILGKPADRADAVDMLSRLSGRTHVVVTGAGIVTTTGVRLVVVSTRVTVGQLSAADIDRYWQSGEPVGKAGAYAIQGAGAALIRRLEGSYSNVVGLPLFEVADLLAYAGISTLRQGSVTDLTNPELDIRNW